MCADHEAMIAHIEGVIFPHLASQLLPDPVADLRAPLLVEPTAPLHLAHYPLLLALLREDPTEPCIVRGTPEREVDEEEELGRVPRKAEEEDDLRPEEGEIEDVQVTFGICRMEQRGEHVVRGRDAEDWIRYATQ